MRGKAVQSGKISRVCLVHQKVQQSASLLNLARVPFPLHTNSFPQLSLRLCEYMSWFPELLFSCKAPDALTALPLSSGRLGWCFQGRAAPVP
jgi:hypothetical protein